jgi:hypothetical protein
LFSPVLLAIALSPVLLQTSTGISCSPPGDTTLSALEFKVLGEDQIVFDSAQRTYKVWLPISADVATVRANSTDPGAQVSYTLQTSSGLIEEGDLGVGGAEISVGLPLDPSWLKILVEAPEGARGRYRVQIWRGCSDCDDGNECTADTCDPVPEVCIHDPVAIGTSCDFASVGDGVCNAGVCLAGTWGTAVLLETDDTDAGGSLAAYYKGPQVAVDPSGNVTAVWSQHDGTAYSIYANHYPAGGPWGSPVLVETSDAGDAIDPKVAVDANGNVTAIWRQWDGAHFNIYANHYPAGGPWGTRVLLETDDTGNALSPQVAADAAGNLTAVWSQWNGTVYDVYANQSPAGGPWGAPVLLETDDGGNALHSQVAVDPNGNVTVVWWQEPDGLRSDIYANHYPAGGPWGTAVLLETDNAGDAHSLDVAVDPNGNVTAVWAQWDGTRTNIYANHYPAGGPWGTRVLLETDDTGWAGSPQVAVDPSGNVTAVWSQADGSVYASIYANHYPAGGPWGTPVLLETDDTGGAVSPQVAADAAGNLTAVWSQQHDGTAYSIYANQSPAGGPWGAPVLLETDDAGEAIAPQLAVDGNVTAVWIQFDGTAHSVYANRFFQ